MCKYKKWTYTCLVFTVLNKICGLKLNYVNALIIIYCSVLTAISGLLGCGTLSPQCL